MLALRPRVGMAPLASLLAQEGAGARSGVAIATIVVPAAGLGDGCILSTHHVSLHDASRKRFLILVQHMGVPTQY